MKKKCKTCDHKCHCVGQGYNVSTNKCDNCICDNCTCGGIILGSAVKKSFIKRCMDWVLGIFK